ncbi:TonB-dependent receptor [Flavihumibacter sp. R14]|nr:TonB-dependent receptor [Flavihumibacter soli]
MKKFLLSTFVLLLTAFSMYAQVTTSSLTGTVSDQKGETLPGASVVAIHTPSGTRYSTAANVQGKFTILNMRVGGPYSVEVTYIGYEAKKTNDVFLKLGEPYVANLVMQESGTALQEVVITGVDGRSVLNADRTGSTTNITRAEIANVPSITRSVNDLTKFTPQANSTTNGPAIGGGNYRQNNFTVDGSDFNNQFGIGGNLPANGSPISLDALEEISINVTPYDASQSGFVGSSINAVTRSGRNNFFGTAFYNFRSEDEQGDKVNGSTFIPQSLNIKTYGASFGGPIIKDKLFFFVNAELNKEVKPGQNRLAGTPQMPFGGSNSNVARPTASELDMIRNYLVNTYNYDPGVYQGYSNLSNNDKLLARLDWNISNNHRFNVRYNQVESKTPAFISTSTSGSGFNFPTGRGRQTIDHLHFSNSNYFQDANLYSLAAELNSSFGSKFSNTIRGSYTHQNDPRSTESTAFPLVDILKDGAAFTSFGYEPFTYGNLRDVTTYSVTDNFAMNLGNHQVTLGAQMDLSTTKNGFQRFGTGNYVFASWDDFVNKANPVNYAMTYSLSPGYEQAFPTFKFQQYAAYVQDAFSVGEKLKLTAGLRVELPTYPDVPEIKTHPLVAPLTFANGRKIDTGVLPAERLMWSPRFGFNYDVKGDRSLQFRGGTGIFTTKVPFVWIVAQSGDAGLIQFTQNWVGKDKTPGPFNPDINAYLPATPPAAGTSIPASVSAIDPDFKFPQTWKSSLAVDAQLPFGIVGTLEGVYNKDLNIAKGFNVNLENPAALNVAGYPDNRPIYPNLPADKYINNLDAKGLVTPGATGAFNPVVLDNAADGHSWFVTAKLDKRFSSGLQASFAYTRSEQKILYDGNGDQLLNTWSLTPTSNTGNEPGLSYSSFNAPHRVIANISYRKEFLKNLATSFSVFYEGSNQGRFSYMYSSDFNRDGQNNDLMYVPKDASEITFVPLSISTTNSDKTVTTTVYTPEQQSDLFFAYVAQDDYLSGRKGQYAERNGGKLPWRNQVDLRLTQDIFKNIGTTKNTFQFTVDIMNLGNMLNSEWSNVNFVNNSAILVPVNTANLTAGGTTKPTFRMGTYNNKPVETTFGTSQNIASTYYMQFGFRYNFQ